MPKQSTSNPPAPRYTVALDYHLHGGMSLFCRSWVHFSGRVIKWRIRMSRTKRNKRSAAGGSSPLFLLVTAGRRSNLFCSMTSSFRGHGNHWIKCYRRWIFMRSDQTDQWWGIIETFSSINEDDRRLQEALQYKSIQKLIAEVLATSQQTNAHSVIMQGLVTHA